MRLPTSSCSAALKVNPRNLIVCSCRLERDINKIFEKLEDLSIHIQSHHVATSPHSSAQTPRSQEGFTVKDESSPETFGTHPLLLVKTSPEGSVLKESTIQHSTPYAFIWYLHDIANLPFELPDWLHMESLEANVPLPAVVTKPPSPDVEEVQRYTNST